MAMAVSLPPIPLIVRVLRAKYFPNGNILEAVAAPGISYTWRSILKGLALLKEGLIWRVGNGTCINIWRDPWLPVGDTRRPRSLRGRSPISLVADLLNPITGDWDVDIVSSLFQPEDVKAILSINVCDGMEDFLAWHFDPRGQFSVKSAYKLGVMLRDRNSGKEAASSASSNDPGPSFDWNQIWHLKAPTKIKMFVWRVAHNSLATRMKIHRIGVELDTRCPVYNRLDEDGGHVFLKCKAARTCWNLLGLGDLWEKLSLCTSSRDLLTELWKCDDDTQLRVATFMWEWWNIRNKVNAGESITNPEALCSKVERLLVDFLSLKKPAKPPKPPDIHK
jgi:hypothetical protein